VGSFNGGGQDYLTNLHFEVESYPASIDTCVRNLVYRVRSAVQAILGMLNSQVRAWHCSAAELLGRLVVNPDNEAFLLPFVPQVF
jgi:hypothetical protein